MSVGRSVGRVTHSFDDPHVEPYWPTWLCFYILDSFFGWFRFHSCASELSSFLLPTPFHHETIETRVFAHNINFDHLFFSLSISGHPRFRRPFIHGEAIAEHGLIPRSRGREVRLLIGERNVIVSECVRGSRFRIFSRKFKLRRFELN